MHEFLFGNDGGNDYAMPYLIMSIEWVFGGQAPIPDALVRVCVGCP